MRRRLVPLTVVAVAAASLSTIAAPARAESSSVDDAVRDVVMRGTSGSVGPAEPGARAEPAADIRDAVLNHGAERVKVVVHLRDLGRARSNDPAVGAWLRTPSGDVYRVDRFPTDGGAVSAITQETEEGDVPVECEVVGRRLEERDEVTLAFDRSCLGDPQWLRYGVATQNAPDTFPAFYVDDVRQDGEYAGGRPRIAGPKVYAGRRP